MLSVELKDKTRLVSAAYGWIDKYLKFLTLQVRLKFYSIHRAFLLSTHTASVLLSPSQRGKGIFYLGVGILVFFMAPDGKSTWVGKWGVTNVAAMVLAIVGGMHTLYIIRDDSALPSDISPMTQSIPAAASDGMDFSGGSIAKPGTARAKWEQMHDEEL